MQMQMQMQNVDVTVNVTENVNENVNGNVSANAMWMKLRLVNNCWRNEMLLLTPHKRSSFRKRK